MGIFISIPKTMECIFVALFFAILTTCCAIKPLGALQSLGYNGGKFLKWTAKKGSTTYLRLLFLSGASLVCSLLVAYLFAFLGEWASIIALVAHLIFFVVYVYADSRVALKIPFSFTARFKRLIITSALVFAVIAYVCTTLLNFADYLLKSEFFGLIRYSLLAVLPMFMPLQICVANGVAKAFEIPHNNSYVKKASKKLANSKAKVVAITGSFAKTSVKGALDTILSQKYKTLATPHSYNTPMGVALTINSNSLDGVDVLIVEMGARNKGDIAQLCAICPPDYSIITGVCEQHLETFKSLETVVATKGEIIAPTKNITYIAPDYFDMFKGEKIAKCDCVKDVKADCTGTTFTLCLGDEERSVKTKLLGEHSAYNVGLACQVAFEMGMTIDEIAGAIDKINFVDHRLQLIKAGEINVIDDGYNSNPVGAKNALKVLNLFDGRKIVVTPGLVELGTIEESTNFELGAMLVGFDAVILVGETQLLPLKNGFLQGGGDQEKLFVVPTLAKAQDTLKNVLRSGDTVLFMNDLPDLY